MRRVEVKNGIISLAWRDPPYYIGKLPRLRDKRQGTIMVYRVDRKLLDPKVTTND